MEEAGEVFEAHILASLAPTTEHLILIGDHEQLRPKPQLYALQAGHLPVSTHSVLLYVLAFGLHDPHNCTPCTLAGLNGCVYGSRATVMNATGKETYIYIACPAVGCCDCCFDSQLDAGT